MTLKTRGSAAIDKAQRRLANLKSIDENLDLGYGLAVDRYAQLIETTRRALEAHNTLVSRIDESRRNVDALEQQLADYSAQMLSAVSIKYGRRSNEYRKAGGSIRKGRNGATQSTPSAAQPMSQASELERVVVTNGRI